MEIIVSAKDRQAAEANKNASILLEELDQEKSREENKKIAAARKREKKRRKRKEKQEKEEKEQKEKGDKKDEAGNSKTGSPEPEGEGEGDADEQDDDDDDEDSSPPSAPVEPERPSLADRIQLPAVEQVSAPSILQQQQQQQPTVNNNNKASNVSSSARKSTSCSTTTGSSSLSSNNNSKKTKNEANAAQSAETNNQRNRQKRSKKSERDRRAAAGDRDMTRAASEPKVTTPSVSMAAPPSRGVGSASIESVIMTSQQYHHQQQRQQSVSATSLNTANTTATKAPSNSAPTSGKKRKSDMANLGSGGIGDLDDFGAPPQSVRISPREKEKNKKNSGEKMSKVGSLDTFTMSGLSPGKANLGLKSSNVNSPTKRGQRKEEGWKEVIRKSKKVAVPANAISRVIGRGGCNINAIREVSGAHIEVDKQKNTGGDRMITIKGSAEVTRQAHNLITALVKDPDKELDQILPKLKLKMPVTTTAAVTTNTATFTATMWHNSMANNIPTVTSSNAASNQVSVATSAASASSKIAAVTTKTIATTKAAIVTTAATLAAMMPSQNGFANAVRQQVQQLPNVVMSRANAAAAAAAISTGVSNGAVQAAVPGGLPSSPKRLAAPGTASTAAATSVSPAKGAVRALFTDKQTGASQHQQNSAANPKSTVTYTQASMAKTKVVTSTMPTTFAAKVDNRTTTTATPGTPKMQPKLQGVGGGASQGSKTPTDRQPPMGGKSEPQPLPIKTTTPVSMQGQGHLHHHPGRGSNPGMSTGGPGLGISAAAEYSPFNNIFSQLQERVIGKKEDQMNFASVAAAGVVPPPQERQINSGPPQHDIHADPNLIAKAPGYKAPGQRTTSPQVNELEPSKAPGYKGGFSPGPASDPLNEPLKSPNQFPGLSNMGHHLGGHSHHHHHHPQQGPGGMGGSPGGAISMDTFRVPPPPFIPGGADYPPDPSRFRLSAQMNASSPRGSASSSSSITGGGQSPKPLDILSQLGRDEYSMPNQPMTLPRIESTLNPNAPDFTSRSDFNPRDFPGVGVSGGSASRFLQAQQYAMLHQQQQQGGAGHGRESGSSGGRNHPPPPGGPHGSALPPHQDMRVPPPTGAPPPPTATMLSQQNFNALLQTGASNLVLPPGSTNMPTVPEYTAGGGAGSSGGGSGFNPGSAAGSSGAGSFLNPAMMGATGTIPVATVGVVTSQQRQYQGASPMQHQHSASAPGSAHPTPSKADGSPGTTVASDGSPTSSSAPSPTDHSKLSGSTGSTAGGGGSGGPGTARGQVPGADDDKRFPQPIGAGRTNKKPAGSSSTSSASQNIFQLGDPAANAGLWAFAADLNADWISAVSSVMTTSVVTSAVMSGGAGSGGPGGSGGVGGVELDERPASHPAAISPHLLPTAFSPDPTLLDPSLDQLQTAALLVPNTPGMGGAAAVFANGGIPPAAAATAVLSIPPLYTAQPPVGDTGLPSMWGPTPGSGGGKLAPQVQDTVPVPGSTAEAKMLWNNWTAPSSM